MQNENDGEKLLENPEYNIEKCKFDWVKLDSYLEFKASLRNCSFLLGVSEDTIQRHIKNRFNCTFREYREGRMAPIGHKLAEKAVTMAMQGNVPMLIFCLKNLSGWSDKIEHSTESDKSFKLSYSINKK
jgi:hypothetical protein